MPSAATVQRDRPGSTVPLVDQHIAEDGRVGIAATVAYLGVGARPSPARKGQRGGIHRNGLAVDPDRARGIPPPVSHLRVGVGVGTSVEAEFTRGFNGHVPVLGASGVHPAVADLGVGIRARARRDRPDRNVAGTRQGNLTADRRIVVVAAVTDLRIAVGTGPRLENDGTRVAETDVDVGIDQ